MQVKREALLRAPGTWHIAGPAPDLANTSSLLSCPRPLWDTAERPASQSQDPTAPLPLCLFSGAAVNKLPHLGGSQQEEWILSQF